MLEIDINIKIHNKNSQRNNHLNKIQRKPNNEFYTFYEDIEKEIQHYKEYFKDKVVYLPCDDYKVSQFFMYFTKNFHNLGLKKLICSCYKDNNKDLFSESFIYQHGYYVVYEGLNKNGKKLVEKSDIQHFILNNLQVKYFKGNGDFRSQECKDFFTQSDIIITNPPFSLFRAFVLQCVDFDKKFLVIGNYLSISYLKIFKLFKENKIWDGINEVKCFKTQDKEKNVNIACRWFTNLGKRKIPPFLKLTCKYDKWTYPKYDFYDAINVDKTSQIPKDYKGIMGVPMSFLYSYNPKQFKLLGISKEIKRAKKIFLINGSEVFARVLIEHRI